jgi:hypothetical protein
MLSSVSEVSLLICGLVIKSVLLARAPGAPKWRGVAGGGRVGSLAPQVLLRKEGNGTFAGPVIFIELA